MVRLSRKTLGSPTALKPLRHRGTSCSFPTFYHFAPLLPTLCPDCSWLRKHVKKNCLQNEKYLWNFSVREVSLWSSPREPQLVAATRAASHTASLSLATKTQKCLVRVNTTTKKTTSSQLRFVFRDNLVEICRDHIYCSLSGATPAAHSRARLRSNSRSRVLRVSAAARSNSARASSWRPSLASRSARTLGSRW